MAEQIFHPLDGYVPISPIVPIVDKLILMSPIDRKHDPRKDHKHHSHPVCDRKFPVQGFYLRCQPAFPQRIDAGSIVSAHKYYCTHFVPPTPIFPSLFTCTVYCSQTRGITRSRPYCSTASLAFRASSRRNHPDPTRRLIRSVQASTSP